MVELLCKTEQEKAGNNIVEVMLRDDKYMYSDDYRLIAADLTWQIEGIVKSQILRGNVQIEQAANTPGKYFDPK